MSNQTPRRVNIQFSIELDELPAEVSRLLQKSSDHLSEASKTYSNIGRNDNNLTSETWGEIDNIRVSLAKADQVLDDLQNIIAGYVKMKSDLVQPQTSAPVQQEEQEMQSPFLQNHPDAPQSANKSPFGIAQGMDMSKMQSEMANMMANMQNTFENAPDMSEEEQQAAEVLKNRLSAFMNKQNEDANKTT
ncbi:MAG: hypothetical protein VW683_11030 [Betaproteobacteria bacterium]